MEPIFIYFIKAGALIFLFLTAYYFFLRKETFFKSNRWFLLFGLVSSIVLPVVTFKKTIWIEPAPAIASTPALAYNWSDMPAQAAATINEAKPLEIDWFWVAVTIYGIGILALLVKFALDFYALKKVLKGKPIYQQEDYKFVNVKENIAPFSYFNYIVYNPELYSSVEMENILEHEKVHCSQNHTIDVLIARIFCIAFWWNPFVWLYKKAIVQNLEFIADSDAFKNISDKKAYQFTLLKITTHDSCVAISNHFFQSLIKKRIVMLNKNQSKRWNSWKYAIIIPALAVFMWQFQVKVVAQEKQQAIAIMDGPLSKIVSEITPTTTNEKLEETAKLFKQEFGASLDFSKIKRNSKGEIIGIKATVKGKGGKQNSKSVYQVSGDDPIKPFKVFIDVDENGKEEVGFGETKKYQTVNIQNPSKNVDADYGDVVEVVEYSSDSESPEPTPPPTPPSAPNYPAPPATPNFPTPPTPPAAPKSDSNKKAWNDFEKEMEQFKTEMNSEEIQKFKEEMKEYATEMASMDVESAEFKQEMKAFQKEMVGFQKEMMEFNKQVQQEVRTEMQKERESAQKEREEARKIRDKERAVAEKEREKAKKEREAAQKERK